MKVKRSEGSQERQVLIGMITNRAVLGAIASRWTEGMFSSRWGNLIASWCVDYYKRYKKPPGRQIQTIFDQWAGEASRDKETIQLVEKFLSSLSSEYASLKEGINTDYVIDLATAYFTKVRLKELTDSISAALEENDIEAATDKVAKFGRVQIAADGGVNVLMDKEAMQQAFDSKREPLIEYPHGLGVFFGDVLERDGFIAFQGTEKRGKTFMLLDLAWNAMLQGRKVLFFEVGDLSKNQIMRRFMVRAAEVPVRPQVVDFPIGITIDEGDNVASVETEKRVFKNGLDFETAQKASRLLAKKYGSNLKLYTYPNSSISVYGIQSVIDSLERNDWTPDVLIVDYADILAPPTGVYDTREQINTTWKMLRSLSQQLHCLVITATQAKATAYSVETMGMQHFSEDKRKNAHVTGMVGLNANDSEKKQGILRLNWVNLREEGFSESTCCHLAQCLPLGMPCVCSVMI